MFSAGKVVPLDMDVLMLVEKPLPMTFLVRSY
jgi:hypothetical protein